MRGEPLGAVGVTQTRVTTPATRSIEGVGAVVRGGRTEHFEAWFSAALGEAGRSAAATVLNRAERDLAAIRGWFGDPPSPQSPVAVVLARLPDDMRAYRIDGGVTVCCDLQTTPRPEPLGSAFLLATQLTFLVAAAGGWSPDIAAVFGRVLATALYPRRIVGFATAALWLDGGRPAIAAGGPLSSPQACGGAALFLNYLHHQLGFSWEEIVSTPVASLGELAARLTGEDDTEQAFMRALAEHFPAEQLSGVTTDNPFPLVAAERPTTRPRAPRRGPDRRVCLLTGASGTLGSFLCDAEAARYDFVAVHRRRPAPAGAFAVNADLLGEGECERVVDAALQRFGRIDLVVNAAVWSVWGSMLQSAPLHAAAVDQFATNAVVPMRLACAVARGFWDATTEANRAAGRNVINVSSISGQHVFPNEGQSVYAASKAALDHLTGHMALEFAPLGVRVNAVAPNSFPSAVPLRRVADAIIRLDEGAGTGTIAVVDGDGDYTIPLTPG